MQEEQNTKQLSIEEQLSNMELHEELHLVTNQNTRLKVIRVVGGWLYNGQFVSDQQQQIARLDLLQNLVLAAIEPTAENEADKTTPAKKSAIKKK
jgi:hypothetical protein